MKFKVYFDYKAWGDGLDVYIIDESRGDRKRGAITDINKMEMTLFEPGEHIPPSFTIGGLVVQPFLQGMANALSDYGIRPEGEPILENELTATKYHLEDMRRLVFNGMKIKLDK